MLTWKSQYGETKNENNFIFTNKLKTLKNVAVLDKLKSE